MNDIEQARLARNELSRADQAKELISHPLYQEAIAAMEAAMFEEFKNTKLDKPELRHELWQRMQLMKQFQAKFEHILKNGEKAKETLTLLERGKQIINRI